MRKGLCVFIVAAVLCAAVPIFALAQDDEPSLETISFTNAEIDGGFDSETHEYTLTLEDSGISPALESYAVKGDAKIFINYVYDETNHQTGLTAELKYDAGSKIYDFTYSNPAQYTVNGNNRLASIYSPYGELSPELNDDDTSYKLYIPSDLTELTVTPVTSDINAYCAPVDLILSEEQTPKITLTCVASDGSERLYTLNIKRVDKTTAEVDEEMKQPGYTSFVEGTRFFEDPQFAVIAGGAAGGALVLILLFALTKRIAANPYDKDEKPFYGSVE